MDVTNPHLNSNLAQAYLEECDFVNAEHHAKLAITYNRDSVKVRLVEYMCDKAEVLGVRTVLQYDDHELVPHSACIHVTVSAEFLQHFFIYSDLKIVLRI